jgi:hypothetical protein
LERSLLLNSAKSRIKKGKKGKKRQKEFLLFFALLALFASTIGLNAVPRA